MALALIVDASCMFNDHLSPGGFFWDPWPGRVFQRNTYYMSSEENKRMMLRLGRMSLPVPDLIALLAAVLVVIGSIGALGHKVGRVFRRHDGCGLRQRYQRRRPSEPRPRYIGRSPDLVEVILAPAKHRQHHCAGRGNSPFCGFRLDWSVQLVGNIALSGSETRRRIFLARVRRRLGNHGRDRRRFRRGRCLGLPDVERPFSVTLSYPA